MKRSAPMLSRRSLLKSIILASLGSLCSGIDLALATDDDTPSPSISKLIKHPLLVGSLYQKSVSNNYDADGAAGTNVTGYRWIEEQRQGAEWIVRGFATGRPEWLARGWRQLDWGLERQRADGSFSSDDPFHSTSFFVEALARSCLIDPTSATPWRIAGLKAAADWLQAPQIERVGAGHNQPYTHRRYILAAAFGQAGVVTKEKRFSIIAERWAEEGLSLQQDDGTNPEKDGYDVGYQMVGVLMALRYLPVCPRGDLRARIRRMIRRAVAPELARQANDGSIDPRGSTRIGNEHARNGKAKDVPYAEIMQALVYGAQSLPEPRWVDPARKIAVLRGWIRP